MSFLMRRRLFLKVEATSSKPRLRLATRWRPGSFVISTQEKNADKDPQLGFEVYDNGNDSKSTCLLENEEKENEGKEQCVHIHETEKEKCKHPIHTSTQKSVSKGFQDSRIKKGILKIHRVYIETTSKK